MESVLCNYLVDSFGTTWIVRCEVGIVFVDTDAPGVMGGFGSAVVSSAGNSMVKVSVSVVGRFPALANYSEGYSSLFPSKCFGGFAFYSGTAALGGYISPADACGAGNHCSSGCLSDDVVGEVPDKAGKTSGSFHFGGLETDCPVVEGDLEVPLPFCVSTKEYIVNALPLGSKMVASHISFKTMKNGDFYGSFW